jgi:formylglycine-generating enzyme required for sulfatase activity
MMAAGMTGAQAITIDTVDIGNPGNSNDSTGYGAVNYTYAIGKYEVNLNQYTAFLNSVAATDTYSLYNTSMETNLNIAGISRSGSNGSYTYSVIGSGLRPVTYVSWFDAARFANWMANGQPTGAQNSTTTEDGAYTLNGAMSGVSFTKNAINPNTGAAPTWWIPSEDEWYKAAYYDPTPGAGGGDNYWLYPTQSDSQPGNVVGAGANQANYVYFDGSDNIYSVTQSASYDPNQNYLTDGGAFSNSGSFYGTFDQGGNVFEWNDAVIGSNRGRRGGSWINNIEAYMQSSVRSDSSPTFEHVNLGFRVASVPEPSTAVLMLLGGGAYWLVRRRKVTL